MHGFLRPVDTARAIGTRVLTALAIVGVVGVVGVVVVGTFGVGVGIGKEPTIHRARWTGFPGRIAPWEGPLTIEVHPDGTLHCALEGSTGSASGNGWSFRGRATVHSTSCDGRINDDGTVSAQLMVHSEWHGQVRGWDSDWDDADGASDCTGPLTGSLTGGGAWQGSCAGTGSPWTTSLQWSLPAR